MLCIFARVSISSIIIACDVNILLNITYPLWTGSTTVDAAVVLVCLCDLTQLGASLRIDFPHFTHLDCVTRVLLSVVGMRKRGVLLVRERSRCRWWGDKRRLGCLGVVCCRWMLLVYCHVLYLWMLLLVRSDILYDKNSSQHPLSR